MWDPKRRSGSKLFRSPNDGRKEHAFRHRTPQARTIGGRRHTMIARLLLPPSWDRGRESEREKERRRPLLSSTASRFSSCPAVALLVPRPPWTLESQSIRRRGEQGRPASLPSPLTLPQNHRLHLTPSGGSCFEASNLDKVRPWRAPFLLASWEARTLVRHRKQLASTLGVSFALGCDILSSTPLTPADCRPMSPSFRTTSLQVLGVPIVILIGLLVMDKIHD